MNLLLWASYSCCILLGSNFKLKYIALCFYSVSLLLADLIKHTKKENKDHRDLDALQSALDKIKEILNNINEDKRKTEGQVCLFEIFSDIQDCPPNLVNSHRR